VLTETVVLETPESKAAAAEVAQRAHERIWAERDPVKRRDLRRRHQDQLRLLNVAERWELKLDGKYRVAELVPQGRSWGGE
jgi:hypothetical protein